MDKNFCGGGAGRYYINKVFECVRTGRGRRGLCEMLTLVTYEQR